MGGARLLTIIYKVQGSRVRNQGLVATFQLSSCRKSKRKASRNQN